MGFYYVSIFSLIFLVVLYAVVLGIFWFVWSKVLTRKFRGPFVWVVVAFVLVAPWLEEFWIAYNFGQLCKKDAGLLIKKTVEVEGFYDDTTHWWRQLAESKYQFVESRDNTYGGLFRVERDGDGLRHFKIDRPTARYHFSKPHSHTLVAYKTKLFEYLVEDKTTSEVLAREKTYARQAPWFYIGLDRPTKFCAVSGSHGEKIHVTLYDLVLKPARRQ